MRLNPSSNIYSLSPQTRWLLILGTAGAYVIIYVVLGPSIGDGIVALATLPTLLAAWFFGVRKGFGVALVIVLINAVLFRTVGNYAWDGVLGYSFGPGTMSLLIVTLVVGRMHDASKMLSEELGKRKQTEEDLRESEE